MLWHCVDNSSYQGCTLPEKPEPYDEEDAGENSDLTYNQDNALPSENVGWGQESSQFEVPDALPSENVERGQEPSQFEVPKPVTDEAEWSDGWK